MTPHPASGTATLPILLYHSVADRPTGRFGRFTVTRAQLASHLDLLAERHHRVLTAGELADIRDAGGVIPPRSVVVTFDDGLADFAEHAWPALRERGMGATLYVTAGLIGRTSTWLAPVGADRLPMLTAQQLRDLAADGCEIGSHTMTHPNLDCLRTERADREIRLSRAVLEEAIGRPVEHFAYPHGYHSGRNKQQVAAAGYRSAMAVRNVLSHGRDDPFALSRVTITDDIDAERLAAILDGHGSDRAAAYGRPRTWIWRQVRRLRGRIAHGHAAVAMDAIPDLGVSRPHAAGEPPVGSTET